MIGLSFGLVGMVVLLLAGGLFVINTEAFQNKMLGKAVEMLEEKLQTRVDIDSVSVDLLTLDAELYGLLVEDRQHRKMLQLESCVLMWTSCRCCRTRCVSRKSS